MALLERGGARRERITTVAQPWVVPVDNGIAWREGSNIIIWPLLLPVKI